MHRPLLATSLLATLVTGCVPNVIRVHPPQSVEAFCGGRVAQITSVLSVLTSAEDALATFPVPSSKQVYENVKATGGVIAHWNHQPLLLPHVAKELGYPDDYVILGDAAITNRQAGVDTRRMYLTVQINGGAKIISVRAFDLQDICNEGAKSV